MSHVRIALRSRFLQESSSAQFVPRKLVPETTNGVRKTVSFSCPQDVFSSFTLVVCRGFALRAAQVWYAKYSLAALARNSQRGSASLVTLPQLQLRNPNFVVQARSTILQLQLGNRNFAAQV